VPLLAVLLFRTPRGLRLRSLGEKPRAAERALGGPVEDWSRLRAGRGERFGERLLLIAERRMALRILRLEGALE
jgi:hypothetical protein